MTSPAGLVHIIDDDADLAESLRFFFDAHWIAARTYPSAEAFLNHADPEPGCLLVDLRMPGMGGLGLIQLLAKEHRLPPTIVLTGHGDVPAAVSAMKLGASEFLVKPHDSRKLLALVEAALARGVREADSREERRRLLLALEALTPREHQVLAGLIDGGGSREIAEALGLQPKSVEIYRSRLLSKLGFGSSLELVGTLLRTCPEYAEHPAAPAAADSRDEIA